MTIHIRKISPSDKEFILSLITRFSEFELPEWRRNTEIDQKNLSEIKEAIEQPKPDSAIYVAEDVEKGPVGFIHLQTESDYFSGEKQGYIADIAVDSGSEGKGIGRLLLDKAENWARMMGYDVLTLNVFAGNHRARQIYEKNGFQADVVKYGKSIADKKANS